MAVLPFPGNVRAQRPRSHAFANLAHPIWQVGTPMVALLLTPDGLVDSLSRIAPADFTYATEFGKGIGSVGTHWNASGDTNCLFVGPVGTTMQVGSSDFWVMSVFRLDGFINQGSSVNTLFSVTIGTAGLDGIALFIQSDNKLQFGCNQSTPSSVVSPSALNDSLWHVAVAARIGSTGYLWLDGKQVASATGLATPNESSLTRAHALNDQITGARGWVGGMAALAFGTGTISDSLGISVSGNPWQLWQQQPIRRPMFGVSGAAAQELMAQACL